MATCKPRATLLAGLLAAASASACGGGGTEPRQTELSGSYTLLKVAGQDLPYVTDVGLDGSHRDLVAGKIEFRTRGRLLTIARYEYVGGASAGRAEADTIALGYTASSSRLLITRPVGTETRVDTATVVDNTLSLRQQFTSEGGVPLRLDAIYVKSE